MSGPAITVCPHCAVRILPSGASCPACGKALDAPREPAPRMPPPPSIHPLLYGLCLLLVAIAVIWYLLDPVSDLPSILRVLGLGWIGNLGILILTIKRAYLMRRWKRQKAAREARP